MPTILPAELHAILKKTRLTRAIQLNREKRVYNLKNRNGKSSACVLDSAPLPFTTSFGEQGTKLEFDCDCGQALPCLHNWSLLVRLYESGSLYHPQLRTAIGDALALGKSPKSNPNPPNGDPSGEYRQSSLFELEPDRPPKTQTSAHHHGEAKPSETAHQSFDLFDEAHLPSQVGIPELSFQAARTKTAAARQYRNSLILLRFQAINRPELCAESVEGPSVSADPEPSAAIQQLRHELIQRIELSQEKQLSLGQAIGQLVRISATAQAENQTSLPFICFAGPKRPLNFHRIQTLGISAQFHRHGPDGRSLYQLRVALGAENLPESIICGPAQLAREDSLSYHCPRQNGTLCYREQDPALALLISRIAQLPGSFNALDYERLRLWLASHPAEGVHLQILANERFSHQEIEPKTRLTLKGSLKRTELFLNFDYAGVECAYHDSAEQLSRVLPDKTTLVMPRRRDSELASLAMIKEICSDMTQHESGLYANLIAHQAVADVSVQCELAEFVTRYGAAIMAVGIELRMEGKRVRAGGGLSFRAESDLDWFGFRAAWKAPADENSVAFKLNLDSHLEDFGMAGAESAEGESAWILLGKRDIDRLRLLRKLGMDQHGNLETSPVNVTLIDSLYDQTENRDESHVLRARNLVQALDDFTKKTPNDPDLLPQPHSLRATLRNYQLLGFNWLSFLHRQKLGGCLADDMGLGKTVQTIALLQSLREKGELGPSLLIAPVVTVPNWEDELQRFAPELRVKRHGGHGRATDSQSLLTMAGDAAGSAAADLIVVSYHTLRNDLDLFVQTNWYYIILDEAHYIKSAGSQIFKAIRVLPSQHRLSLTGTPIENSTMELWSQFSFLNPGLLGSRKAFSSEVASPIEREGSETALATLRDTISPFILRRRKEDVLADLPPKSEILHWCEMAGDQAKLYEEHRQLYHDQIAGLLNDQGVEKSSMDIFRCLLRLRQIAINPAMISRKAEPDDELPAASPYAGISSAKMESLRMILDESLEEDHKTLVFSQFVSALKLVSRDLDQLKLRHALLTGATVDRRSQVFAFQNDPDLRIFLLSLKAGGVGINLTQADYVVLFDPWWNPAAERQAVDRAHRIGQTRPVLVYKFITRGTIEEKILALQAKKHRLAGSLIDNGETGMFHGMQEDEIMELFGK